MSDEWSCPWILVGEDTIGNLYWCKQCGCLSDKQQILFWPDECTSLCLDREEG